MCRLFLSSLQLAADRNIDIVKSVADGVLSDDFGIKVLAAALDDTAYMLHRDSAS